MRAIDACPSCIKKMGGMSMRRRSLESVRASSGPRADGNESKTRSDHVQTLLSQWRCQRPDLDVTAMGVVARVFRAARLFERSSDRVFRLHGLSSGAFDVLAALRRSGPPYRMTPARLAQSLLISTGAMTNRIDRLEDAELVMRIPSADDRRSTLVGLTNRGRRVIDEAVAAHVANEAELTSSLTPTEQDCLAGLLAKLLSALERVDAV